MRIRKDHCPGARRGQGGRCTGGEGEDGGQCAATVSQAQKASNCGQKRGKPRSMHGAGWCRWEARGEKGGKGRNEEIGEGRRTNVNCLRRAQTGTWAAEQKRLGGGSERQQREPQREPNRTGPG